MFYAILVYVSSSNRQPHVLLDPSLLDISAVFDREFAGMTRDPIPIEALLDTRQKLTRDIRSRLHGGVAEFLLSLHEAAPDFDLIGLPNAADLPAVRWKVQNIETLKQSDEHKHSFQGGLLRELIH